VIPRPRINLILYHGVLPFDVAQGTPSKVEGWGHGRRGPSTLLRAIPSNVEGWRSLVVGFGNTANRGEASTAHASTAEERADSSEVSTTDAPTAGVRVDPREARATEPEGWWALPADRADRRGGGDRAHSAPSALAHRGPRAASGASAAPRRGSGRPEPGRRAPLLGTCSFNQDTDVAVFT